MLPTFVIGLREGIEAALIVGIIAAYVKQRGRPDALRWIWIGVALAAALCLGLGLALHWLEKSLPQRQQEGLETIIAVVAIVFISYMIIWMRKNSRGIKSSLEGEAADALAQNSMLALIAMAFLAVLREGFETAVFVLAVFQNATDPVAAGIGVVLGLAVAAVLGFAIYRGGVRINLSRFFRVTGVVLAFVAAGLAASALHTAHEAGWFNILQDQALDLTWLVAPGTVRSALLTGMLGLQPKPTVGEVAIWLIFVVVLTAVVIWPTRQTKKSDGGGKHMLRKGGTALGVISLIVLLVACGGSDADDADSASTGNSGSGVQTVDLQITDAGCDPFEVEIPTGPTKFNVSNKNASAVTEAEVLSDSRILGEVENLVPGLSGSFTLNLSPGEYTLYCPNGTEHERGTLTVTGVAASPVADEAAEAAVAQYQKYVIEQADFLVESTTAFVDAVKSGDIEKAKELYPTTRVPYERIEPVAESFGDLDPAIDAREGDVPDDEWTGFHVIEKALWVDNSLDGMEPVADKLLADVKSLREQVEDSNLSVEQIANGAVELLNEVSASKITGEEERYSHTDLIDFAANVDGSQAAYDAVQPILATRSEGLATTISEAFTNVDTALADYADGDSYVLYTDLTEEDTRKLSQVIDALAEPLSRVAEIVVGQGS